jgi:hypothetical protein
VLDIENHFRPILIWCSHIPPKFLSFRQTAAGKIKIKVKTMSVWRLAVFHITGDEKG